MHALYQFAHEVFQVPPPLEQGYLSAGIGVLIVAVTGIILKFIQSFQKQKATEPTEEQNT